MLLHITCSAQNWLPLGPDDFNVTSPGSIDDCNFTAAPDGTLYIAYEDYDNNFKLTVRKHDGSKWSYVGMPGFSANSNGAANICLAIAPDGTPYVAYVDFLNNRKATVKKFNGSAWIDVGAPNFSDENIFETTLAIAPDGTPYISYNFTNNGSSNGLTVKKYNGSSWVDVGSIGLSATETVNSSKLAIAPNGTAYLAYNYINDIITPTPTIAMVKKFNGSNWVDVGLQGLPDGGFNGSFKLVIAADGSPYLSDIDLANGSKATVKKFNGSSWVNVGIPGFSENGISYIGLAIAADGTVFVCYKENNIIIKKYDGSNWVNVGTGVSDACCFISIAISNGVPCIGYHGDVEKAIVKKFNGTDWQYVGDVTALEGYSGSLAIAADNIPYIATGQNVKKFNNGSWIDIGTPDIAANAWSFPRLTISPDNTLYVVYADSAEAKATVKKYNGSNWVGVGMPGFSTGVAESIIPASTSNNLPWIAYKDWGNSGKVTVKKYNGSTWETAGTEGFSANPVNSLSFCISPSDTAYVAYQNEQDFNNKASVKKFNGTEWVDVGIQDFTAGRADYPQLYIAPNSIPYLAYIDVNNGGKLMVKKYDGSSAWVNVGPAVSDTFCNTNSLVIAPDGTPYIAYTEGSGFDGTSGTMVKKYNGTTWELVGTPNISATGAGAINLAITKDGSRAIISYSMQGVGGFAKYYTLNYTFNGTGNWSDANNWANKTKPPANLPQGSEIFIAPSGNSECLVDTEFIITPASKLTVKPGKKMRINGGLIIH